MKLEMIKAVGKVAVGSLQLLIALSLMVEFFYFFDADGINPLLLISAVILSGWGTTWIRRGSQTLAKGRGRDRKPKPPRLERPKGPPGKQRPDKERRKRRGTSRTTAGED